MNELNEIKYFLLVLLQCFQVFSKIMNLQKYNIKRSHYRQLYLIAEKKMFNNQHKKDTKVRNILG